ncbi:MAG TPA: cytochrome C [Devosia sp.]|nr:cytochrome C [Devosia sp.]
MTSTAMPLEAPRVRIYLDDATQPIIDQDLPTEVSLDTTALDDGPHRLTIRVRGENGREGFEQIPFVVSNGPGIVITGLRPHTARRGKIRFKVDAFSTDDPFDPRRAEARSAIPVWVWVLSLFVVAWAVWYAARMWDAPAEFAQSPTYSQSTPVDPVPPDSAAAAPAQK